MLPALLLSCTATVPEPSVDFAGRLDVPLDVGWSATPWQGPEPVETITAIFALPAERVGAGSRLVLEGLWWSASVTLNEAVLAPITGGDVAVSLPIGEHLQPGENTLTIQVHGAEDTPLAVSHDGLSRRLSGQKGPWLIEPPRLELRPESFIERAWLVSDGPQVTPHATAIAAPDGARVRFFAASDGALLQELGEAEVRGGEAVGESVVWRGPRWSLDSAGLFLLNAELLGPDGHALDTAAVRTGVRALSVQGARLMLDGVPLPLLAARVSRAERRPLSRWFRTVSGSGINAVEFHGQLIRQRDLDMADALGLPLVVMGRCAGRSPELLSLPGSWLSMLDAHDARLAAFLAAHPSVVLLALEEHGDPSPLGERLARSSIRDWPGRAPMTGVELPARIAAFSEGGLLCQEADCGSAWITEIFDDSLGDRAWPDAADALNARIHAGATGGVAPMIPSAGANAAPPQVTTPLSAQVRSSGQRASSLTEIKGAPAGALVVLEVAMGSTIGAFADGSGEASIAVWHQGIAQLSTSNIEQSIQLTPRRWSEFNERGAPSRVQLSSADP